MIHSTYNRTTTAATTTTTDNNNNNDSSEHRERETAPWHRVVSRGGAMKEPQARAASRMYLSLSLSIYI